MATLFGLLYSGATSLTTQQAGTALTGQNIANARTPGYGRRDLIIRPGAGAGSGVTGAGVLRSQDVILSQRLAQQHGLAEQSTLYASGLTEIEALIQSGQGNLSQRVTELGAAFARLAPAPADPALRGDVLAKGSAVAGEFQRIASALSTVQTGATQSAESLVQRINDLGRRVASLNARIAGADPGAVSDTDLRDQAVTELAGLAGGQVLQGKDGSLNVLVGGLALVHGGTFSELSLSGSTLRVGGAVAQVAVAGELGGQLLTRDAAASALAQFDRLAYDLSAAINAQHAVGVGLDGRGGRPLFAPHAAVPGAALSMHLADGLTGDTLAVGFTSRPGDNRNATALANLIEQPVLEGGTASFRSAFSRIAGGLGSRVQEETRRAEALSGHEAALRDSLAAVQGVSTDEELVRLQAFQRGFEASARFINAVDEMLQTVNQLGA